MALPAHRRYPLRNKRDAPTFTGSGKSAKYVSQFLEDIEALVGQCEVAGGAMDEVLIKKAKYYSAKKVEERLDTIAEVGWGSFKAEVIKMYAEDTKQKYTRATIGVLVDKRSLAGTPDREVLLEYQWDFKVQIDFMKDLSPSEISSLFMRGLPRIVRVPLGATPN